VIDKITITDLSKAESYAFGGNNNFDVWISTVDEEDRKKVNRMRRLFNAKGIKYFYRLFFDWSDEDNEKFIQDNIDKLGPTQQDVDDIIRFLTPFVSDDKVHNLGINCFAGVSRSTAIGIIALVMTGKTPQMAFDYILSIRPQAWPNLRMLRFASNTLGQDLYTPVKERKEKNQTSLYVPQGGWFW
jgi:protein-tyrosine phosphatase